MPRKFVYGPGLPGYGTRGVDGSAGLTGVATWFSSYDGASDTVTIKSKIIANKELFSNDDLIPGYPTRTYQDGDIFIDRNARIYQIDFAETNLYKDTGVFLNTSGFFTSGPAQLLGPGFQRYSNQFETEKYLIDTVYTNSVGDYTTYPTSIYDNAPLYYGNVEYIGSDVEPDFTNYYPFQVWTVPGATGGSNEFNSIALVREKNQNAWHFGNKDGVTLRDASLHLDFKDIYSGGTYHGAIDGTITTTNIQLPGWLNVGLDVSIDGTLYADFMGTIQFKNDPGIIQGKPSPGGTGGDLEIRGGNGSVNGDINIGLSNTFAIHMGDAAVASGGFASTSVDEILMIDTGSSNRLRRTAKWPVSSYSSGASNKIITGTSTTGIAGETYLEYSAGLLTSLQEQENLTIKKENRPFASGLFGTIGFQGSRAADGTIVDADAGGWISFKVDRGGSTTGSGKGGNGGVVQINGSDKNWARGGDVVDGSAGIGGVVVIYGHNGGDATGPVGWAGEGGYIHMVAGDGGNRTNSTPLNKTGADGGAVLITAGTGGDLNNVQVGAFAGTGGAIVLSAGNGGVNTPYSSRDGDGGNITIRAGNADGAGSGNGGDVIIDIGTGAPDGDLEIQNMKVGVTPYFYHLSVAGTNSNVFGSSAVPASDSRLKDLDGSINGRDVLSNLYNYQAYYWKYNEHTKEIWDLTDLSTNHIGLIAQDVEPDYPELVIPFPGNDGSTYYAIDYSVFAPLFVEALKVLDSDVSALTSENITLISDVSALTSENITLTNDVSTLLYVVDNLLTRVEALEASIG